MTSTVAVFGESSVTFQDRQCNDIMGANICRNIEIENRSGANELSDECAELFMDASGSSSSSARDHTEVSGAEDSFVPLLASVLTHLVSLSPADKCQGDSLFSLLGEFNINVGDDSRSQSGDTFGSRSTAIQSGPNAVGLNSVSDVLNEKVSRFHAVTAPDISIRDYLSRIQKYFGCSNECFVLSLVYIDRIVKLREGFSVSILSIHRLLVTAVMLAAKFFDDVYYSNGFYARVGGVRTQEINLLEWQFLALIDYRLFVTPREYDQYRRNVIAALNAGIPHPLPEGVAKERDGSATDSTCPSPSESCSEVSPRPEGVAQRASMQPRPPATVSANQISSATPEKQEVVGLTFRRGMKAHQVEMAGSCQRRPDKECSPGRAYAEPVSLKHPRNVPPLSTGTVTIDQQQVPPGMSVRGESSGRRPMSDTESMAAAKTTTIFSPVSYRNPLPNTAECCVSTRSCGHSPAAACQDTTHQPVAASGTGDSERYPQYLMHLEHGRLTSSGSSMGSSIRSPLGEIDPAAPSTVPLFLVPAPRIDQGLAAFPYNAPTAAQRQFIPDQHPPTINAQNQFSAPPLLYPMSQCSHYDGQYGRPYPGEEFNNGRYAGGNDSNSHQPFCRDSSRRNNYWQDPDSRQHVAGSSRRESLYSNRYEAWSYRPATALPHW